MDENGFRALPLVLVFTRPPDVIVSIGIQDFEKLEQSNSGKSLRDQGRSRLSGNHPILRIGQTGERGEHLDRIRHDRGLRQAP